jgi:acetate kinase
MEILVVNSGSSTLKYKIIDTKNKVTVAKGAVERIGGNGSFIEHGDGGKVQFDCPTHAGAIEKMLEYIRRDGIKLDDISAVGHRVVHGGEKFTDSIIADKKILTELEQISYLAPLHNPANILGVREFMKILPEIPNVLVFDTAFHSTMKEDAFLYGLPYEDYEKYGIRKYGFHGTSHKFVAREAAKILGKPLEKLKLVTCHVGNGASICAVDGGVSTDTSMGMTPLAGLVMGSRSGDIDPAVVATLCKEHNFTVDDCIAYLNRQCGLKGLYGKGEGDMRDIEAEFGSNPRAKIAVGVFVRSLVKYIGAYIAEMGGADAVVWTGGIGIHRPWIADMVMHHFEFLPKMKRLVIPTNEELEIAFECERIIALKSR